MLRLIALNQCRLNDINEILLWGKKNKIYNGHRKSQLIYFYRIIKKWLKIRDHSDLRDFTY
jgi:hypothetical protein